MVEAAMTAARIRPRLPAVWLVLAALIAVALAVEYSDRASDAHRSSAPERSADALLPVPMDDLGAVEVGQAGALHRFERSRDGVWFYHGAHGNSETAHEHRPDPAKAEVIAKGLAGLARARIERRLPLDAGGAQYGLAAPRMLLVIYRVNEPRPFAQYVVGDVAPDSFSRYVLKSGSTEVVTIANYQIDNLAKLLESMKN
jgi:hypothetical protein